MLHSLTNVKNLFVASYSSRTCLLVFKFLPKVVKGVRYTKINFCECFLGMQESIKTHFNTNRTRTCQFEVTYGLSGEVYHLPSWARWGENLFSKARMELDFYPHNLLEWEPHQEWLSRLGSICLIELLTLIFKMHKVRFWSVFENPFGSSKSNAHSFCTQNDIQSQKMVSVATCRSNIFRQFAFFRLKHRCGHMSFLFSNKAFPLSPTVDQRFFAAVFFLDLNGIIGFTCRKKLFKK